MILLWQIEHQAVDTLAIGNYAYDANANPAGTGVTVQAGNRLTQYPGETFSYDDEGNLLTRSSAAGTFTYTWNALGQLTAVIKNGNTTTYGYDGWGRRVRKTANGVITRYLLQGDAVVMELSASNGILAEYSYYPGVDRPLSMKRGAFLYYFAQDAQGNVTGLMHTNGTVAATYSYSAFGEHIGSTGTVQNPYRFKGREWDEEAGLYFMRARYYLPQTGRFISEDPIGLAGGSTVPA